MPGGTRQQDATRISVRVSGARGPNKSHGAPGDVCHTPLRGVTFEFSRGIGRDRSRAASFQAGFTTSLSAVRAPAHKFTVTVDVRRTL